MKKTVLNFVGFFVAVLVSINLFAYDFEVDGIYYNINSDDTSVSVTFKDDINNYSGDVVIPSSVTYNGTTYNVTTIGNYAFQNCTDLTTIDIPNSVTRIGNGAFQNCTDLTSVTIPNSVTIIAANAFQNCTGLTDVTIPNSVHTIGVCAFRNTGLTSLTVPGRVSRIYIGTFDSCMNLKTVTIETGVSHIKEGAFQDCPTLKKVTLPNTIVEIQGKAFVRCNSLDTIICASTNPPSIDNNVFSVYDEAHLIVPCGSREAYDSTYSWKNFLNIIEECKEELSATICDNETYTFAGSDLTEAGIYYDTINIDDKTDSIYILTLTVNPTYDTTIYDTIQLEGAGEDYNVTNIDSLQTIYGCDSIITTITRYHYTSGLEDIANENTISIYPNPAQDKVTIEGKGEIVITNSLGQIVKEIKDNNVYRTLNIKDFERGVYYIKVGNTTQKLVVE